jgi:hypothetical protein
MTIKPLFRELLDENTIKLMQSGILSEDLKWTARGREVLRAIQLKKDSAEIITKAEEYIAELDN